MVILYNPSIIEQVKGNEEIQFNENFNLNATCFRNVELSVADGLTSSWERLTPDPMMVFAE